MTEKNLVLKYEYHFLKPIEEVWTRVSDSNRIQNAVGNAPEGYMSIEEQIQPDNSLLRFCTTKLLGRKIKWCERFGEWIAPYSWRQERMYFNMPFSRTVLAFTLTPVPDGCLFVLTCTFFWKSWFGTFLARCGVFKKLMQWYAPTIKAITEAPDPALLKTEELNWSAPTYTAETQHRATQMITSLNADPYAYGMAEKLVDYVMNALEADVVQMRPLELARKWKLPEKKIIELCLAAANKGLLDIYWDIRCPQCRVIKTQVDKVDQLPNKVHCTTCNLDLTRDFSKSVEMTFTPASWLRKVQQRTYCMMSAQATPHIVVQWRMAPGETKQLPSSILMPDKCYRFKTYEQQQVIEREVKKGIYPVMQLKDEKFIVNFQHDPFIILQNDTAQNIYFMIEEVTDDKLALTAQKVTAMQAFRKLCPEALLRPGDEVAIRNLTFMFTDLKNSTDFYQRIGDSNAYQLVREHFALLTDIIFNHNGAVVKNIGDSIMAVFDAPSNAVQAGLIMQTKMREFCAKNKAYTLALKVGIHNGNCICSTFNNVLDYFGTTINLAARLHAKSTGSDVVISETVLQDPAVQTLLAKRDITQNTDHLKGIHDAVHFYRVKN